MSKTAKGLVEFCTGKVGTPYVYGAKGEVLTQSRINQLARENPNMYTDAYIAKAKKFIGRACTDCSGLISWYTGIIRGSSNFCDTAVENHPVSALNESMTGWALWKPGHIGVYIGGGVVIEAKGINYGTIKSRVTDTPWHAALKLKDIDYSVVKKSGWQNEDGGYRYYLGNTGEAVRNNWYEDYDCKWYWFDGAGLMVRNVWYKYKDRWYYLGPDGAMLQGLQNIDGKWYCLDQNGRMMMEPITLTPDHDGALQFPGLSNR